MGMSRPVQVSKTLSKLLRHQAANEGLSIDEEGFVDLDDVLKNRYLKSINASPEEVFHAVATNNKKRFKVVDEAGNEATQYVPGKHYKICALQGHSIEKVTHSYAMERLDPDSDADWPDQIVHGTFAKALPLILESGGLSKMRRNQIHFTGTLPASDGDGVVSGLRRNTTVLIFLDIPKIRKSGIEFYRSGNGVFLTEGVDGGVLPKEYFLKITDRDGNLLA